MFNEKNLTNAINFHNDLLDLYFEYHEVNIVKWRILEPTNLKDIWLKGRFLVHWILFDVNTDVISKKLAHDIFDKFDDAYRSDRVFIIC